MIARDPGGLAALYFAHTPDGRVSVGRHPAAVAREHGLTVELEREWLWRFVFSLEQPTGVSCIPGVQMASPGAVAIIDSNGIRETRLVDRPAACLTDETIVEEYRGILQQELNSPDEAGKLSAIGLSGGIDSTSLLALGRRGERRWVALVGTSEGCDESARACRTAEALGVEAEIVPLPLEGEWETWARAAGQPDELSFFIFRDTLARRARELNAGVLVTGVFGDVVGGYTRGLLDHWVKQGMIGALLRRVQAVAPSRSSAQLRLLAGAALRAWIPQLHQKFRPLRSDAFPAELLTDAQAWRRISAQRSLELERFSLVHWPRVRLVPHYRASQEVQRVLRGDALFERLHGLRLQSPFANPRLAELSAAASDSLCGEIYADRGLLLRAVRAELPPGFTPAPRKALYNSYYLAVRRRALSSDLFRAVSGGTGLLAPGAIGLVHPDAAVNVLFREAVAGLWLQCAARVR